MCRLKYFVMKQNPSGGDYYTDDRVAQILVIQTTDPIKANFIAQSKGVYFDGSNKGIDCSCCGDRWKPFIESSSGHNTPILYGSLLVPYLKDYIEEYDIAGSPSKVLAYAYYYDGSKDTIRVGDITNRYHSFKFQEPH